MREMSKTDEFRMQAEALRGAAAVTKHEITRETLLKLADEFDRMAENPVSAQPKKMPRFIRP